MADQQLVDGNSDFTAGQDASRIPELVSPTGYYAGINISTRKGCLSPRWGYEEQNLIFPSGGITGTDGIFRPWATIFASGKFEAFIPYVIGRRYYAVIVINGVIFLVDPTSLQVTVLNLDGEQLNPAAERLNWSPAGRFLDIFDYPAYPVILEGSSARRADPAKFEVPVSTLGAFNSNRLFIVNDGNEFTAGDPIGNVATPDAPNTFEEVLEDQAPFFGQIFQLNTNINNDPITAMGFLQVNDTSTGIGPLWVASKNTMFAYQANTQRAQWQSEQFGSCLMYNSGVAGPRSFINVNSDLYMMSGDGQLRTLSMARSEQYKLANIPISKEVGNWLKFYNLDLSRFATMAYFQNKILTAANPFRCEAVDNNGQIVPDYAHAGMVVLELDNLSSFGQPGPPAWAGMWNGIRPMDFALLNQQLFCMSKDPLNINKLYRIRDDRTYDVKNNQIKYIKSRIYTRAYNFQTPFDDKELNALELAFLDVAGEFGVDVDFKPSNSGVFLKWGGFKHNIVWYACKPSEGKPNGFRTQSYRSINLSSPIDPEKCDEATRELYTIFRKVQLRIDITAKDWQMNMVAIRARHTPQVQNNINCPDYPDTDAEAQCVDDWSLGNEDICQAPQK